MGRFSGAHVKSPPCSLRELCSSALRRRSVGRAFGLTQSDGGHAEGAEVGNGALRGGAREISSATSA